MPSDMEDVTIPFGGYYSNSGPSILELRVGRYRGSVIYLLNVGEIDFVALTEIGDAGNNANRRVC